MKYIILLLIICSCRKMPVQPEVAEAAFVDTHILTTSGKLEILVGKMIFNGDMPTGFERYPGIWFGPSTPSLSNWMPLYELNEGDTIILKGSNYTIVRK